MCAAEVLVSRKWGNLWSIWDFLAFRRVMVAPFLLVVVYCKNGGGGRVAAGLF